MNRNALSLEQINNLGKNKKILINQNKREEEEEEDNNSIRLLKSLNLEKVETNNNCVFLTGGIGDVIAVESFLSDWDRENIRTIFYATKKHQYIIDLFGSLNNFKKLKNHIVAWEDFSKFLCFFSLEDFLIKTKSNQKKIPIAIKKSRDLSIAKIFNEIKKNKLKYNQSSFLKYKLASIEKINLPDDFYVILPYTTDKRIDRDFSNSDWNECIQILRNRNKIGVVLNSEYDKVPKEDCLLNLSGKTNIIESIEILKLSSGFMGIDSWLSVLASKLFEDDDIQIKSINQHCLSNAYCYYAPKTTFGFIKPKITFENKQIKVNFNSNLDKNNDKSDCDKVIGSYPYVYYGDLNWCIEKEIAYQRDNEKSVEYGEDYYKKYINYENTEISKKLNRGRISITEKYCKEILDIGIGSGEFIRGLNIKAFGFDINKYAIDWLKKENIYINPYEKMPKVCGITFWDSLEHIPKPSEILSTVKTNQYVFISMPIFRSISDVKSSKHYRPNEHYYYFTCKGLNYYMSDLGFKLIEIDDFETQAGREDILTFVFQKQNLFSKINFNLF